MKLLFVSNLFPDAQEPQRGLDNATLLHSLAHRWKIRALALRPTLPWQARPWQPREEDKTFEPRYCPALYVPKVGSRWNHRLMARALREPLREIRAQFAFDAILGSWLFPDCCALAELAPEMGFKFVAIAQGSDVHQHLRMPARRQIMLRLLPRASAVITRSGELARLLISAGLPSSKLHPIYNGLDFTCFTTGRAAEARRALALPESGRIILFVGNFYAIKNPLLLLEAHAHLSAKSGFADCRLITIGDGPLASRMRRKACQLGTADRVIFAGRQLPSNVARYMQAADVLGLPSWNEGVPNVILEAFACGLPVVASRVGGIPEVHNADFLGQLVPAGNAVALADALGEVLQRPPANERIADHARQFTWERTATAYHRLLSEAIA